MAKRHKNMWKIAEVDLESLFCIIYFTQFVICLFVNGSLISLQYLLGVNGTYISVVSGNTATLPCDISPPTQREKASLILWFKEEEGKPIFRLVTH